MVTDNVERLKRIVDDVMEVAPGQVAGRRRRSMPPRRSPTVCAEWARGRGHRRSASRACSGVELPGEPVGVLFDAEHLRRVLVNLLDNAHRHASAPPGRDRAARSRRRRARRVPRSACSATARRSRPRSSPICSSRFSRPAAAAPGLGLYICRELCETIRGPHRLPAAAARTRPAQRVLRRHAPRRAAAAPSPPPRLTS